MDDEPGKVDWTQILPRRSITQAAVREKVMSEGCVLQGDLSQDRRWSRFLSVSVLHQYALEILLKDRLLIVTRPCTESS